MVNSAQNFQPRSRQQISPIAKHAKGAVQKQDRERKSKECKKFEGVAPLWLGLAAGPGHGGCDGESVEPGALV